MVPDGALASAHPVGEDREVSVGVTADGALVLHDRVRQPVVDTLRWEDGRLHLSGAYTGPDRDRVLVLRHGERFEEIRQSVTIDDGRFEAVIDPEHQDFFGASLPLSRGRWYLSLRGADRWDNSEDAPVKLRPDLIAALPAVHEGVHKTYSVDRRFHDRIFLAAGSVLDSSELGPYRQRVLRDEYLAARERDPLREAVFYSSFEGKQFSDSPRAVYEELVRRGVDVEHIWTIRDRQVVLPQRVTAVEYGSREWALAMARSRYVVNNVKMEDWLLRREGQMVVQTWHGTPLKRIGADLLGTPKANRAYIASLPHRSRQWDFLVSPNTFTTPIMRDAFLCESEILESGYPRNDVFHAPDREARAERTREALGLPKGRKVVLYAPTWRDDQRYASQRFKLDLQIDLPSLREELADDHVLLFRKHPKVLDSIPGAGQGFVWDVTKYPDIADLYLIADVLVTDYSSALFDFAHSGKPMLFYTYDLEHYRDTLRGFYFDLGERAPGPLLKTSGELIKAIRDLDTVAEQYQERYEEFVRDFCDPSDGRAAERVVDRMLNGRG
ncbi:CDP-glycerol glycerophosphotransferase family protein [Nocardiopsis sp. CC223A]|uniref:CDP-glycerol glycerophosphotransferase family protein n=1 Tax=Nocardiopsis sp. CC223A TaxID=3044051 RepID=UPI00278C59E0|nr:CDP-glycerol glycerophosphotransferase family protein [Nocardiopsis sp. CC223A]